MSQNDTFNLSQEDYEITVHILKKILPNQEIWAFGSRVTGTSKPFSDLDLVVMSNALISDETFIDAKNTLAESNLSIKIDLHQWKLLPKLFQEIIEKNHHVFIKRE